MEHEFTHTAYGLRHDGTIGPETAENPLMTFAQQIDEARERLKLPKDATAWQVMNENAAAEVANKDSFRSLFGL